MLVWLILMVVMMLTGDDDSKFDCGDDIDSGDGDDKDDSDVDSNIGNDAVALTGAMLIAAVFH